MPQTTADYRQRADEAMRQARKARNPEERAAFEEIAAPRLRLAEERATRTH